MLTDPISDNIYWRDGSTWFFACAFRDRNLQKYA